MTGAQADPRERVLCDVVDALRAIEGGRACPEHVVRNMRDAWRVSALTMLNRNRRESEAFSRPE
ncbi:hypothetical protein Srufu_080330 (plasmid) [Streptomyces libani subsp. rufus]|nr:hypothetical protein Srufu_080330 [Streptomyces libani subsp. rufus]